MPRVRVVGATWPAGEEGEEEKGGEEDHRVSWDCVRVCDGDMHRP